jgi:dTDP-4-dehydrorhamnose reductase
MQYAILGAQGKLGQAFLRILGAKAVGLTRAQANLSNPEALRTCLADLRPEFVINCAAYNWVDQAEGDPKMSFAVNAWGVRDLAAICRDLGFTLVHYSTNHVFGLDRNRQTPYRETDLPGPLSIYGVSKLAGEYLSRSLCAKHFVIRVCGLFGLIEPGNDRLSFVELMLNLAAQKQAIRVVNDQTCSPTRTDDLAAASLALLETRAFGLYHLTSAGATTWHEFAKTIFELAGVDADLTGVTSQEFAAPAPRPAYGVLANAAYDDLGLPPMRPWREGLVDYLKEREGFS